MNGTVTVVEVAVLLLAAGSVFFTFVAAVGIIRLPDLYARAHAASKADTLGAGLGLTAVAVVFGPSQDTLKVVMLLVFIYLTNPTAAHAISRAAYDQGVEPWKKDDEKEKAKDEGGETA